MWDLLNLSQVTQHWGPFWCGSAKLFLVRTYSTQKMLNEYLTSLKKNKIMNHSIKLNGMVTRVKISKHA